MIWSFTFNHRPLPNLLIFDLWSDESQRTWRNTDVTFLSTTQTPKPLARSFQGADDSKRMIVLYFLLCVCDAELLNVHLLELGLNPNFTL